MLMEIRVVLALAVLSLAVSDAVPGTVTGQCRDDRMCGKYPAICTGDKCPFTDVDDYAQNAVRKSMLDEKVVDSMYEAAKRRNPPPNLQVLRNVKGIPDWWREAIRISEVQTTVHIDEHTLANTDVLKPQVETRWSANCGDKDEDAKGKRVQVNKKELENYVEKIVKRTSGSETSYDAGTKISGLDLAVKATLKETLETTITEHEKLTTSAEETLTTEDVPPIPKWSIRIQELAVPDQKLTYRFSGTVVTDAVIKLLPALPAHDHYIGRWSDFVSDADRTVKVSGKITVDDTWAVYDETPRSFGSQQECLAALEVLRTKRHLN
jgi:hypothetical protein